MSAERYRFHCTDGIDAVFDRVGKAVRNSDLIWWHAERVALSLMEGCSHEAYWSDWIVDIHDESGRRVGMLGFSEMRHRHQQQQQAA